MNYFLSAAIGIGCGVLGISMALTLSYLLWRRYDKEHGTDYRKWWKRLW